MKTAGVIFGAILAIWLLFGVFLTPISDGVRTWRTNSETQSQSVTTVPSQTSANITLAYDLYQGDPTNVTEITSSETETPLASTYDTDTNTLLIVALTDDLTRTLTIDYRAETTDTTMRAFGPFALFLIIFGLLGLIIWGAYKNKR